MKNAPAAVKTLRVSNARTFHGATPTTHTVVFTSQHGAEWRSPLMTASDARDAAAGAKLCLADAAQFATDEAVVRAIDVLPSAAGVYTLCLNGNGGEYTYVGQFTDRDRAESARVGLARVILSARQGSRSVVYPMM